jgi:hypothetical protein
MPLTDYVNLFPSNTEATGGYNTGSLGLTEDDLRKLQAAYDYQTAANTIGQQTPFEQYQAYLASQNPQNVQLANLSGVNVNPAVPGIIGRTNISATGQAPGLPSNIFAGPLPSLGMTGAGLNAIYNLGTAGINALSNMGVNQVALGSLPAGNIGFETGYNPNYGDVFGATVSTQYPGELTGNVTFDTGNISTGGPIMGPTISQPGYNISTTIPSTSTGSASNVVKLPSFPVVEPTLKDQTLVNQSDMGQNALTQSLVDQYKSALATPPVVLPAVKSEGTTLPQTTVNLSDTSTKLPTGPIDFSLIKPPVNPVGPFASTATTQTTATTTSSTPTTTVTDPNLGLGSLVGTATNLGTGMAQRDLAGELSKSYEALYGKNAPNVLGAYGDIYQNLLGQTLLGNKEKPGVAKASYDQMLADQAKLQRVQQGYLNAEDVRQAQQGAREAYAARGQVMGPGAIGAEILNREAIRQQRENEARAGYQASMGNVFNAAQLQTGNIFSPIGNLVSGTFNPLGAYPQDVYSTNVNAQLARDISAANNAAAIEAAKYGAAAQQKAATTGAVSGLIGKLLPSIFG